MTGTTGLEIGDIRIDLVPEVRYRLMPTGFLFPDLTAADQARNADWLGPRQIHPETLALGFAFQAFLVRVKGQNILIDSCNGMHKQRAARWAHDLRSANFLTSLAALGLAPEDIDIVMCTHLHTDHVGWNTRLVDGRWVPTFPKARYIMNQAEFDYWAAFVREDPNAPPAAPFYDSVLPVVEAGQAEFVGEDAQIIGAGQEIGDEVFIRPSPGHSPGHVCVHARSAGQEAVVVGDLIHHAVQWDMPDMRMRADFDPAMAATSRRAVMEHCAGSGAHFCAGHVVDFSITRIAELAGSGGDRFRPV
jgi:glyoxylase-like metal-dependent hydrolase (beta-lactamase superfamily II)